MGRTSRRIAWCTAALAVAVTGCSTEDDAAPEPSSSTATTELPPLPAEPPAPGAVEVSPGGVTTKVDVPADATESQYGQACHAAKVWMDQQGADPATLVEPYLQVLQAPGFVGPGTFNTPWTQLTPAQQAGVIMAVTGAANAECG